jgi:uracil-DNA glycosylase
VKTMRDLDRLIEAISHEAQRADFPIDVPVYERAGRDPKRPVLCAGTLDAPLCVFARDLGKDEVAQGEPLIGAAGRLVREGIVAAWTGSPPPMTDRRLETALEHALLTNTVPYKPPGNKAYAEAVKERFRPYLAELLTALWQGDRVISLGTEAFNWFARYAEPGAAAAFWRREDRYEAELPCVLVAEHDGREVRKPITLGPLPHPSPLNQRWYKQFPDLLARRLAAVREHEGS